MVITMNTPYTININEDWVTFDGFERFEANISDVIKKFPDFNIKQYENKSTKGIFLFNNINNRKVFADFVPVELHSEVGCCALFHYYNKENGRNIQFRIMNNQ